ncbi:hypothetical protein [Spiroplasma apis]|uniref:Lipoprotein n=1 Tax=Spiroplasma apis B31 TaxID=1276258 RepID=V5RIF9_SPIAP|nr:hypothetical protein [Spiroplasma apis]AHB36344.1 hypothetical protein SAPIS_v1c04990 [Spiroplasma apis B31]
MKKLISIISTLSLSFSLGTTSSLTISCGIEDPAKELNFENEKNDKTFIKDLEDSKAEFCNDFDCSKKKVFNLSEKKDKLNDSYTKTSSIKLNDTLIIKDISLDGEYTDTLEPFIKNFTELNNLSDIKEQGVSYIPTIEGQKNSTTFKIYIYKFTYSYSSTSKMSVTEWKYKLLFFKNINII